MYENFNNLWDETGEYSPWIRMSEFDWSHLTSHLKPKRFKKDTIIYRQYEETEYVYLVESGRVNLSVSNIDGEEKCLFIAEKGSMFGEISCLDGLPNLATAITVADSTLYLIPKEHFFNELMSNPTHTQYLFKLLSRKIRILSTQIKELSFADSYYRVANALVHLSREYGMDTPKGRKLSIKFTHQEMASLTGLCRVTVTNIFLNMTNNKVISKENGYLIIKNLHHLNEYLEMKRSAI